MVAKLAQHPAALVRFVYLVSFVFVRCSCVVGVQVVPTSPARARLKSPPLRHVDLLSVAFVFVCVFVRGLFCQVWRGICFHR